MIRSLLLILSFGSLLTVSHAQRITSAIHLNIPVGGSLSYNQNYYNPMNNYRVYMVSSPDEDQFKKNSFSLFGIGSYYRCIGIGVGYLLKLDYKRFGLRFGYRLTFRHTNVRLNQLTDSSLDDDLIDDYKTHFFMESFHHQVPVYFSYDLKRQNNTPFLLGGFEWGYMFGKIESIDWDSHVFYDRYKVPFLYGIYYNHQPYSYAVAGAGWRMGRIETSLVAKFRVDKNKNDLTIKETPIDVNVLILLASKKLQKSRFIYSNE